MLPAAKRLGFLDQARGLIMVFMALDHALYFWSGGRYSNEGLPVLINGVVSFSTPAGASWSGFSVMLLSSLCAPGFLFISGYVLIRSIKRRQAKGASEREIDKHLLYRGLLLLLLQVFVASVAFNVPYFMQNNFAHVLTWGTVLSLSVLSTIGICFLLLIPGRRIKPGALLGIVAVLFAASQLLLPQITLAFPHLSELVQSVLNVFILPIPFAPGQFVNNNFPALAWLFPFTIGWLYGNTYDEHRGIAYEARRFAISGLVSLAAFALLRICNVGDYLVFRGNWQSWFIMSKYPPSLDFFLFYLGLLFLVFWLFAQLPTNSVFLRVLDRFGQVPLFFYNVHLWLFALIPALLGKFNFLPFPEGVGVWLLGLLLLYPICSKYFLWRQNLRRRRSYV